MTMNIQLLRIVIDLCASLWVLSAAKRLYSRSQLALNSIDGSGEITNQFFTIADKNCVVKRAEFLFVIGENESDESVGVYAKFEISGAFNKFVIGLPFRIVTPYGISNKNPEVIIGQNNDSLIISIKDNQSENYSTGSFYLSVYCPQRKTATRDTYLFRLKSLWAVGTPYSEGKEYPLISDNNIEHVFVPKIEVLEVSFRHANSHYLPDVSNTAPSPSVILEREFRWVSGTDGKTHSSINATFSDTSREDTIKIQLFKDGILMGILGSIGASLVVDCVWTLFNVVVLVIGK